MANHSQEDLQLGQRPWGSRVETAEPNPTKELSLERRGWVTNGDTTRLQEWPYTQADKTTEDGVMDNTLYNPNPSRLNGKVELIICTTEGEAFTSGGILLRVSQFRF